MRCMCELILNCYIDLSRLKLTDITKEERKRMILHPDAQECVGHNRDPYSNRPAEKEKYPKGANW